MFFAVLLAILFYLYPIITGAVLAITILALSAGIAKSLED